VSPPAQHAQPYGTQQRVPGMRPSPPLGAWGPSSAQERK
jgi:hypothetical protein